MTPLHYISFALLSIVFIWISLVLYRSDKLRRLEKQMDAINPINRIRREELAELMTKYNDVLKWKLW